MKTGIVFRLEDIILVRICFQLLIRQKIQIIIGNRKRNSMSEPAELEVRVGLFQNEQ